jgi:hypothetical protein
MNPTNLQLILWALPLFMFIHVIEEFGFPGGFIQWMATHNTERLHHTVYYVAINAIGILAGVIAAVAAPNIVALCAHIWLVTYMATNSLSHIIASLQTRRYCPGTVTGLLFIPLLVASSWMLLSVNVVNWESLGVNVISAFAVGYFFITVHRREKAVQE